MAAVELPPRWVRAGPSGCRQRQRGARLARFGTRTALGLVAVLIGAVPFLALLVLVVQRWGPLQQLDSDVAASLNTAVAGSPLLVRLLRLLADGGGTGTGVYVLVLAAVCLAIRRQRRLAVYVIVTGLRLAVLVPLSKVLVGRDRPDVELPVVTVPANASFPSGHAMTSLVTWGAAAPRATVGFVLVVGATRLALGVHFVTDVLAGYALGQAWLTATTAAFRGWQHDQGRVAPPVGHGLDVHATAALRPAPTRQAVLPQGTRTVALIALSWAVVCAAVAALGLALTGLLDNSAIARLDTWAVHALLEQRTSWLNQAVTAVNALSGTRAVVLLSLAQALLELTLTGSWRPVLFVALTVLGQVSLYFVAARVVGRARPAVPDLTSNPPMGASFPSGHVAAAVAVYGTVAGLVVHYRRARARWLVLAVPALIVPAVAVGRVYVAAHHPTDVLAGALLGTLWLLALAGLFLPAPDRTRPAQQEQQQTSRT